MPAAVAVEPKPVLAELKKRGMKVRRRTRDGNRKVKFLDLGGGSANNSMRGKIWQRQTKMMVPDIAKVTKDYFVSVALESAN